MKLSVDFIKLKGLSLSLSGELKLSKTLTQNLFSHLTFEQIYFSEQKVRLSYIFSEIETKIQPFNFLLHLSKTFSWYKTNKNKDQFLKRFKPLSNK